MKRFFYLILISFLISFFSCKPNTEKKPNNLIGETEFKKIAIEFHMLESYIEEEYKNKDTARVAFFELEKKVLEKYKISKEKYKESYNYYLMNTKQMDNIYESIIDSLGSMETQSQTKKSTPLKAVKEK